MGKLPGVYHDSISKAIWGDAIGKKEGTAGVLQGICDREDGVGIRECSLYYVRESEGSRCWI